MFSPRQTALKRLVDGGQVRMQWAPEVMEQCPPCHLSANSADRVRGMMLGLAIGDSLGNTSEGLVPAARRALHGEIRDYLANRYTGNRRVGLPSDDTQLAAWLLEHLNVHGCVEPTALAQLYASRQIFGMGVTTRRFVNGIRSGQTWVQASQPSAGNGALMRIAPVLIPHVASPNPDLWVDAVLGSAISHNDPAAIGTSVAYVVLLSELVGMNEAPPSSWWTERFVEICRLVEGEHNVIEPRDGPLVGRWRGPLWRFVLEFVPRHLDWPVSQAGNHWYSGAYLLETVPTVLHILARHAADPEEAIVRAVNDTKDNDTIAAIVGAAVGALHGERALPERWRRGLLGRTTEDDDGHLFQIIEGALQQFGLAGDCQVLPRS